MNLIFFALFPVIYVVVILWKASLGPIDDHLLLDPLQPIHFIFGDRFYPLDGIEQFFILNHFGLSPFLFYGVNAVEFLALFWILFQITKRFSAPKWLLILAALTPGLATAYFRLFVPERLLVLCLSVLVLLDLEDLRGWGRKCVYLGAALVALFLKEPAFLLVGGLSFFRFIEKKDRVFHTFIMLLCISFLGIYLAATHSYAGAHYGASSVSKSFLFVKNLFNFSLNDPLVLFFSFPLWGYTLIKNKVLDPYLTLVVGYLFVFLVLGIFQEYYLLPLLPFILVSWIQHQNKTTKPVRTFLAVLATNVCLGGLHQIYVYKNDPRGFLKMVQALRSEPALKNKKVCYLGLNEEFSNEILQSSAQFLGSPLLLPSAPVSPTTPRFVSTHSSGDTTCDYSIDSPYNYDEIEPCSGWKVVDRYDPAFDFPAISIKSGVKALSLQLGYSSIKNKNVFGKEDFVLYQNLGSNPLK